MPVAPPGVLPGAAAEGAPPAEHAQPALLRPGPPGLLPQRGAGAPRRTLQRYRGAGVVFLGKSRQSWQLLSRGSF